SRKEPTTDCTHTRMSGEQSRFAEFRRTLSIRQTHIDYHYAFYRIIQPVRDCVVADYLDLPNLERGILIAIVALSPRPIPQAVDELHDLLSLRATFRHRFEQIDIQINLIGFHLRLLGVQALFELFWCQP